MLEMIFVVDYAAICIILQVRLGKSFLTAVGMVDVVNMSMSWKVKGSPLKFAKLSISTAMSLVISKTRKWGNVGHQVSLRHQFENISCGKFRLSSN